MKSVFRGATYAGTQTDDQMKCILSSSSHGVAVSHQALAKRELAVHAV